MKRFFKSTGFKVFVAVIAILFAGSVLAATTHSGSSPFSSAVSIIFSPIKSLSAKIANGMSGLSLRFKSSSYYMEQIDELEIQLADARKKVTDYNKLEQQNRLYENFLDVKEENPNYSFVPASITGYDANDKFNSFTLNKGSVHDVSVNDTVIYNRYLVGVVTSVMPTQCTVGTILNPSVNISAFESRTRESGFVESTASDARSGICRFSGIAKTTNIAAGGIICTSGTGGIYPRDLMIGEITEISDSEEDISSFAVVKPYVDFESLIDVFIITDFTG